MDKALLEQLDGLKKFRKDFNNPKLSLGDFRKYKSDFDLAFAFCKLFFPDFVEVEGCVLLAEVYDPETFESWKKRANYRAQDLEAILNHCHVYDLFSESDDSPDVNLEICEEISRCIARSWAIALKEAFPDKKFVISLSTEPEDYGPTLTFRQSE